MVMKNRIRTWYRCALLVGGSLLLMGCPGPGDRMQFDETASVYSSGDDVCFSIASSDGYRLYDIAINLRGTPPKDKKFIFNPALIISDGRLCISPSFYRFADDGEFIVKYLLVSNTNKDDRVARKIVAGVGMKNKRAYNLQLTDREIARPYGELSPQ